MEYGPLILPAYGQSNPETGQRCVKEDIFLSPIFLSDATADRKMEDRKIPSLGLSLSATFRRKSLYDIALLVQGFDLGRALSVDKRRQDGSPQAFRKRSNSACGSWTSAGRLFPSSQRATSSIDDEFIAVQPAVPLPRSSQICRKTHEPHPGSRFAF